MEWVNLSQIETQLAIARRIEELLCRSKVTWFVSGGSNIGMQLYTMQILWRNKANLEDLTILLADERYGEVGHANSNWELLKRAGFMLYGPRYIEPFTANETTLDKAVLRYENEVNTVLSDSSYKFAQLGMGDDGHISGILPNSPAAKIEDKLVTGYDSPPYFRLTTTFTALQKLNEVALVVYGKEKWPQLEKLKQDIDKQIQPVQFIKNIKQTKVYTDYRQSIHPS